MTRRGRPVAGCRGGGSTPLPLRLRHVPATEPGCGAVACTLEYCRALSQEDVARPDVGLPNVATAVRVCISGGARWGPRHRGRLDIACYALWGCHHQQSGRAPPLPPWKWGKGATRGSTTIEPRPPRRSGALRQPQPPSTQESRWAGAAPEAVAASWEAEGSGGGCDDGRRRGRRAWCLLCG